MATAFAQLPVSLDGLAAGRCDPVEPGAGLVWQRGWGDAAAERR